MRVLRPIVSIVTALAFLVQATGLAHAAPPQDDVQPVPYSPSQPIPVPAQPVYPAPPPAPVAPPGAAYAPAGPGADSVYLKGGGMMRGTLVEMIPNDHLTLQMATGQSAIVEWGKIEHIERGAVGAGPGAPRVGVLPPPRRVVVESAGSVSVHLDADPGVVLESIAPGSGRWALVCAAPCDGQIPLARQYRVAGEGIRPSRPFAIEAPPGQRVTISVSTGSRSAFGAGVALSSIGVAAVVIGVVVLSIGAFGNCDVFGNCTAADGSVVTAGAVVTIGGAALLVGGVILMASNARTRAIQTVGDILPQAPSRPETAWLRAPLWHDAPRDSPALPVRAGVPLFSTTF